MTPATGPKPAAQSTSGAVGYRISFGTGNDRAGLGRVSEVDPAPPQQRSRGGRPVVLDAADYKNCNVVERAFNPFKNWRGLATQYDKHALTYRGGVVLAAIMLWLS